MFSFLFKDVTGFSPQVLMEDFVSQGWVVEKISLGLFSLPVNGFTFVIKPRRFNFVTLSRCFRDGGSCTLQKGVRKT